MTLSERLNVRQKTQKLVLAALFAALVFVVTCAQFSLFGQPGNVNLGDACIFLAAVMLPAGYAGAAAAVGAGLSDLIMGFPSFIPATVVIKFLMGMTASLLMRKNPNLSFWRTALAATVNGCIMVVGYGVYVWALGSFSAGQLKVAAAESLANLVQFSICAVIGTLLVQSFRVLLPSREEHR